MQLKNSILEKITYLNDLLIKIDRYWTKVEITKATKKYNSIDLQVDVYTFLKEDGQEEERLAYIINEKINLMGLQAEQNLDCLLEEVKKLIISKEEEAECQTN